jgi:sirohydrochlorin cobaltochelatase
MSVLLPLPTRRGAGRPAPPWLLLVAHGSGDPAAAVAHAGLVDRVRAAAPGLGVTLCHVDHTEPSLAAALAECAAGAGPDAGGLGRVLDRHGPGGHEAARHGAAPHREVVAVPLLLSAAAHAKSDIPGALQAAAWRYPGLRVRYAAVLGPHPLLLDALAMRLRQAGVERDAAVVLAAAGSADPDANAEVARVARLLWEWRGGGPVEPAFASATVPTVAEAVDRLRRLGHERIAVASYFLAPGRLPATVRAAARPTAARPTAARPTAARPTAARPTAARPAGTLPAAGRPAGGGAIPVTEPLADTDQVAALVLERYAQALAGPVPANCDTCHYRTPWPGREHRVGAPQRPHRHPADACDSRPRRPGGAAGTA